MFSSSLAAEQRISALQTAIKQQRERESFFSTLKIGPTNRHGFENRGEARQSTFERIEGFYNKRRRHSSIGSLSSVDFENQPN